MFIRFCRIFVFILSVNLTISREPDAQFLLEHLLAEFWQWRLSDSPEFATSIGVHAYDTRLESFTEHALKQRKVRCERVLQKLDQLNQTGLTDRQRGDVRLLRYELQTVLHGFQYRHIYNPINYLEGIHKDFSLWMDAMPFETPQDIYVYQTRLEALSRQIKEQIDLMKESVKRQTTSHAISIQDVPADIASLLSMPVNQSPFLAPLNHSFGLSSLSARERQRLRQEIKLKVEEQVLPAYRRLMRFMIKIFESNTRRHIGLSGSHGGSQFYEACLQWYISFTESPYYLYTMAQQSIQSSIAKINTIKDILGFSGTLLEFLKYSHGAKKFFHTTTRALLAAYNKIIFDKLPAEITQVLYNYTLPPISVEPMMFDGPMAIMMPGGGAEDYATPAVFFVNVQNPFKQPKWKIRQAVLREIAPGRLYQITHDRKQAHPAFRKHRELRKMYSVPFQFPFHAAFTEGWALYAESLGPQMNAAYTLFDQYGRLYSELHQSVLQAVDVGIHVLGWSHDMAVRFIRGKTGSSTVAAKAEVDKVITWPGRAVAAPYGARLITQLRQTATLRLGSRFDIREFHEHVLSGGPVPLTLLRDSIHTWLDEVAPLPSMGSPPALSQPAVMVVLSACCWAQTLLLSY